MSEVKFERENRYIVIKRSDLKKVPVTYRSSLITPMFNLIPHLPKREYVVVESDWPEYNFVWLMLEHRMAGYPLPDFNDVKCAADCQVMSIELEAQRLRADTAEAERDSVKQTLDATRDALESAQYSNAELASKLSDRDQLLSDLINSPHAVSVPLELWKRIKVFADAALNPKPEAGSDE